MVQFKALILVTMAIISLNNISKGQSLKDQDAKATFFTNRSQIELFNDEIVVNLKNHQIEIRILDEKKLFQIQNLANPQLTLHYQGKDIHAKGNQVFSSSVPKGVKYFFPLTNDGNLFIFKQNAVVLSEIISYE